MNGIELARAIQAARPDLPVILVTGYGDRDAFKEFGESFRSPILRAIW
jgi:hypothetical protein